MARAWEPAWRLATYHILFLLRETRSARDTRFGHLTGSVSNQTRVPGSPMNYHVIVAIWLVWFVLAVMLVHAACKYGPSARILNKHYISRPKATIDIRRDVIRMECIANLLLGVRCFSVRKSLADNSGQYINWEGGNEILKRLAWIEKKVTRCTFSKYMILTNK